MNKNWFCPLPIFLPDRLAVVSFAAIFWMSRVTSEKKLKRLRRLQTGSSKAFLFFFVIVVMTTMTKKIVCILSPFSFVFADSPSCGRGCPCPSLGYLSSSVFHERREEWWRDVGGHRSAIVFHHVGSINIYFYLEDWEWKPRNPGETNEVWRGFCLSTKTSLSAKVKQTLLHGDTSWCLTQSRI